MNLEKAALKARLKVLLISLFVSVIVMGLKWWAYIISSSVALKTDALESFVNIVAIIMAITAIYQSQRPADSNHPYGHGKIEYFSSIIEGGMLLFASCFLLYEAGKAMIEHNVVRDFNNALYFSGIAGICNGILGVWQLKRGKILASEAILADAKHIISDFYTTVGVIIGLFLVKITGLNILDAVIGALIALMLLATSLKIIRRSALILSDIEDPKLIQDVVDVANSLQRPKHIINIHMLRSFRSGNKNYVDLHLVLPEFWDVRQAHDRAEEFCALLRKELKRESEFHPHVEPCMKKFCAACEVAPCPIRLEKFKELPTFTAEEIVAAGEEDTEQDS